MQGSRKRGGSKKKSDQREKGLTQSVRQTLKGNPKMSGGGVALSQKVPEQMSTSRYVC